MNGAPLYADIARFHVNPYAIVKVASGTLIEIQDHIAK
jgi:hypothetical protein